MNKKLVSISITCFFILFVAAHQLNANNGKCTSGDCKNGHGTVTFENGKKFVGNFTNGKANGKGTITYPNGKKFVGTFKNGKREGKGTLTYANGEKFVGEYRNGKRNGKGILYGANGKVLKKGVWENGKFKKK